MYYVYVIQSKKDSKFYTGCTGDLQKRFTEHNEGKVLSTKVEDLFRLYTTRQASKSMIHLLVKNTLNLEWGNVTFVAD